MPKTLTEPPPTSSVARLLDKGAVARALSPGPSPLRVSSASFDVAAVSLVSGHGEIAQQSPIKREFVLSRETDATLATLVSVYRQATGSRLSASHIVRALLRAAEHGLESIDREAQRLGLLKLPSNGKDHEAERKVFEAKLAGGFIAAMRTAPPAHTGR